MRLLMAAAIVAILVGCKPGVPPAEPTYQGKKQSEWRSLTKDADSKTRSAAYVGLAMIGGEENSKLIEQALFDPDPMWPRQSSTSPVASLS